MSDALLQQYGIFLITAGGALALLLILFLLVRRNAAKSRGLRPAALAHNQEAAGDAAPSFAPRLDDAASDTAAEEVGADAGGFKLFKRNAKSSAKAASPEQANADDGANASHRLAEIEQEMLAIRELFRAGEISRSVYVAETKALYETARLIHR